jgi:cell division protease FtsH
MSRADNKKSQEMSRSWCRVARTLGVPAALIEAAERSEMWNDAVARAVSDFRSVVADCGGDDSICRGSVMNKPSKPKTFSPRFAIIAAALTAAMTVQMRRALAGPKAAAFVVQVPSIDWIGPLEGYLREYDKLLIIAGDGSNKALHTPNAGNSEVSNALSHGRRVVGIAVNPRATLPSTLIAAADHVVKVPAPNGAVILDAMQRCYGRGVPDKIDDALVAGLDLEDLVAVMRQDSRPSDVMKRLRKASQRRNNVSSNERLPKLEDAVEYGAARTFGLALAQDFAAYKAGGSWADASRGAVWHSDPGLGKSLLAKILANACDVPLITASVAELFATSAGYLDSVIKAQRALFARAQAQAPCILFLDEIDAIPNRATISARGADWWMPVINDFLMLLDSAVAGQREGVVVIGATNRIEAVDAAIMRPGRLEVAIHIQRPDPTGIANILRFHLDKNLASVDLTGFATMLIGSTGADIMLVVRNARRTARQAGRAMIEDDLIGAIMPPEGIPAAALRRMSIHEAAHAVATVTTGVGRVAFCRLQSNAVESGRTAVADDSSDFLTAAVIENKVVTYLAGRAAERHFFAAESDGCGGFDGSDLARATATIAALHISDGLGGTLVYRGDEKEALREVRRDGRLRAKVEKHLQQLHGRAEVLVRQHRDAIAAIADELAARRFLSGAEIEAIMAQFAKKPRPFGVAKRGRS